ncbi:hypothetical protein GF336_02320 [Candidatus Woesearchaeota archaeon]|nr:hypothetical protein [Candidatus Woesearchaeota archaeon]
MTEKETLDNVLKKKVEPMIGSAMHRFLGITVSEISEDISDRIENNPLISYEIDVSVHFKTAKKLFKKEFLTRLLQSHYGNISSVARITGLNRRSIHRDVKSLGININKTRKDMLKTDYYQKEAVDSILRETFDDYRYIIRPKKLQKMYENVSQLSGDIIKELPALEMTWKEAEHEFEKAYLKKALKKYKTIAKTSRNIRLRYETLHRKLKKHNLLNKKI